MPGHYVIKGYQWGYNDETYYPEGGFVHDTFTNEADAKSELIRLERRHWRRMDLSETHVLFDGDEKTIAKLNKFLKKKLNTQLDESGSDVFVPRELNDEDFIKFLDMADIRAYKLIETNDEPEFWALWIPENDEYLTAGEDESFIFAESIDQLKEELEHDPWSLTHLTEEAECLEGTLEELSNSPLLLKELIASRKGIAYADGSLGIDEEDIDAHFAVNELLKTPIFELRKLSIDEVKQLQGFTSSSPASEFEQDVESVISAGLTETLLDAFNLFGGKSKKPNVNAFAATSLTEEVVRSVFEDLEIQEKKFDAEGVMKHISHDFKAKITTRESGKPVTMPLSYGLYKMSIDLTMRPEMKFESHETIEKIDIQDDIAYVTSTAQGQCIDPLKNELVSSNTSQLYELKVIEGKVLIVSLVMDDIELD